jgi:hypothetical protein
MGMKGFTKALTSLLISSVLCSGTALASTTGNQTDNYSPILPNSNLPFTVNIQLANFQLPVGLHSGVMGVYHGIWVFIAGRIAGMHNFNATNNFPTSGQNFSIWVVNPATGQVSSRSLSDASSGLSQPQIDALSVTSPEGYQDGNTLFIAGGYGWDTATGNLDTKPVLTALNLPGVIQWVTSPCCNYSLARNIMQTSDPLFQIAGGEMYKLGNVTQLAFGENFTGQMNPSSNGDYSQQVRQFQIVNGRGQLAYQSLPSIPSMQNPNFRRKDLNVVPVILNVNNMLQYAYIALSGVFTSQNGVWNAPVIMNTNSDPVMPDVTLPSTFLQSMNNYNCATVGLYSKSTANMYTVLFGGMTYGFYLNGTFQTDSEIPFTNEVTTIKIDQSGNMSQYLMDNIYPNIISTTANPGNQLLFGAEAYFVPANIPMYPNGVINLDNIRSPTVIGYIVGGIASSVPNTSDPSTDTFASPFVFTVTLAPR